MGSGHFETNVTDLLRRQALNRGQASFFFGSTYALVCAAYEKLGMRCVVQNGRSLIPSLNGDQ